MREITPLPAGCFALSACAGTREVEVRLEITEIEDVPGHLPPGVRVWLDPVGELPEDAYDRQDFTGKIVEPAEIDGEVRVGDEVICLAGQRTIGALRTDSVQTELFQCRKA